MWRDRLNNCCILNWTPNILSRTRIPLNRYVNTKQKNKSTEIPTFSYSFIYPADAKDASNYLVVTYNNYLYNSESNLHLRWFFLSTFIKMFMLSFLWKCCLLNWSESVYFMNYYNQTLCKQKSVEYCIHFGTERIECQGFAFHHFSKAGRNNCYICRQCRYNVCFQTSEGHTYHNWIPNTTDVRKSIKITLLCFVFVRCVGSRKPENAPRNQILEVYAKLDTGIIVICTTHRSLEQISLICIHMSYINVCLFRKFHIFATDILRNSLSFLHGGHFLFNFSVCFFLCLYCLLSS